MRWRQSSSNSSLQLSPSINTAKFPKKTSWPGRFSIVFSFVYTTWFYQHFSIWSLKPFLSAAFLVHIICTLVSLSLLILFSYRKQPCKSSFQFSFTAKSSNPCSRCGVWFPATMSSLKSSRNLCPTLFQAYSKCSRYRRRTHLRTETILISPWTISSPDCTVRQWRLFTQLFWES